MDAILVVDISNLRVNVSYVGADGAIIASNAVPYAVGRLADWVEESPSEWWDSFIVGLRAVRREKPDVTPVAIALSGQTQNVIFVDEKKHLDAAIASTDQRGRDEWLGMVGKLGVERILKETSNVQDVTSALGKLLWFKRHQPTIYNSARTLLLGSHDYMAWRLCGARVTDYTTASASGLFDLNTNEWASDILAELELRTDWLPELVSDGAQVGVLSEAAAREPELPPGIPVFHGAPDYATALLGLGITGLGEYACYLGKSGWLATGGQREMVNPLTGILNLREPGQERLIQVGRVINAGGNVDYLCARFGELEVKYAEQEDAQAFDLIMALAGKAAPGSAGVIYLPFLEGEQSPYRDPHARAGWFHVSVGAARNDLYRSVLEGVAFSLRAIHFLMPEPEVEIANPVLNLIGSPLCTPLWAQIMADVFDCEVRLFDSLDRVLAKGAAWKAGKALGWFGGNAAGDAPGPEYVGEYTTYTSVSSAAQTYEAMFAVFFKLYPALQSSFAEMAAARGG